MTRRGRLIAVAGVVVLVFAGGIVELVRSRTPECSVAAPRPSLPPALRAIGDFDQAYDAGNLPALEDAAARAAGTLHSDLIGTSAEPPVEVAAQQPAAPAAEVLPLRLHAAAPAEQRPLAGLVVFLLDCQGNAYFATVEDDATAQPPLTQFPPVSREQAAAQLGSAALRLDYATSPLHPQWVTVSTPIQSVPAR
jgi:hypothetical protein